MELGFASPTWGDVKTCHKLLKTDDINREDKTRNGHLFIRIIKAATLLLGSESS